MSWLRTAGAELVGLFVDDGSLAVAVLLWVAATLLLLPRLDLPQGWLSLILFVGLAAILVESAVRRAGQRP